MRDPIEWYTGLPTWLRFGVSGLLLLVALVLLLTGDWWNWAWAAGVGLVLLIFAFPSDASRKGYHDF